jgi:hypothetical protein
MRQELRKVIYKKYQSKLRGNDKLNNTSTGDDMRLEL